MSEFKITERKIKILWIIVFIFIFLDFITTLIDVVILGYDELNPFVKHLLYEKDLMPVISYALFIIPLAFYGLSNLSNSKKYKLGVLLGLIIIYSSVLFNNFYLMIT